MWRKECVIDMLIEVAKCPHCGGKVGIDSDFCIYCGFGLIYKNDKEGVKEKPIRLNVVKEGRLIHLAHEREYYGCPICLKKQSSNATPLCAHIEEPVKLFWRKYVARDSNLEKFVVECTPRVEELSPKKKYKFYGIFYSKEDRFIVNRVEELKNWGE